MKPSDSLHNTIISEYEKRLKDSAQIIKEIELELGNVTDAKVISELQVAIGDEQVKIKSKEDTHMELQKARDLIESNHKKRKEEILKREHKTIDELKELISE